MGSIKSQISQPQIFQNFGRTLVCSIWGMFSNRGTGLIAETVQIIYFENHQELFLSSRTIFYDFLFAKGLRQLDITNHFKYTI